MNMDNESLKDENETKKEECSMICAQKPNDKTETALKLKLLSIRYNP